MFICSNIVNTMSWSFYFLRGFLFFALDSIFFGFCFLFYTYIARQYFLMFLFLRFFIFFGFFLFLIFYFWLFFDSFFTSFHQFLIGVTQSFNFLLIFSFFGLYGGCQNEGAQKNGLLQFCAVYTLQVYSSLTAINIVKFKKYKNYTSGCFCFCVALKSTFDNLRDVLKNNR